MSHQILTLKSVQRSGQNQKAHYLHGRENDRPPESRGRRGRMRIGLAHQVLEWRSCMSREDSLTADRYSRMTMSQDQANLGRVE